ncbi:MAG TPA: hypothetical protein VK101_07155 [Limnochordia bacterium]|nr:hypothetical protein [Limnochordia bacterium]
MIRLGRLLFLLLVIAGVVVALRRLSEQHVLWSDVALTGLWFVAGLLAFFLLLLGFGKLLGRWLSSDKSQE